VLNPSTTTTVRLTGKITGGAANQTFRLADSGTVSNNYNVLVLDNSSNSFQGNIEILRGTLAFTSNAALGNASNKILLSADSASSSLRFDANNITLASTHQIVLNNSANPFPINVRTYTGTIAGPITGGNAGATFVKQGTGKLILAGTNTYAGSTQIDAGILEIGTGGTLPGGNVIDNATLAFNSTAATTWNNAISGTGGLVKDNSGTLTLTASDTYSGTTRILNGTLTLSAGGQLPNSAVENNSAFKITGGTNHSVLSIVGTGTLYIKGPNTQLTTTSIVQDSLIIDSAAETLPVPEPGMFALLAMFGIAALCMKVKLRR
jgi:fibronectin-binding autotransporter adhesin